MKATWRKNIVWLLLLAAALAALMLYNAPERTVMRWYDRHFVSMTDNTSPTHTAIVNVWTGDNGHEIREYIVTTRGFGPSCRYYGVFYSPDNLPASFQNGGETLTAVSDTEWTWQDRESNHGLVRQLAPNWFYFAAKF